MATEKSVPKNLYDLAKVLARWDNDGGATRSAPQAAHEPDEALRAGDERILRCLGAAVILRWNDLPTDVQRSLFEDAASMEDPARRFRLRQHIAQFLHDHKDDAEEARRPGY